MSHIIKPEDEGKVYEGGHHWYRDDDGWQWRLQGEQSTTQWRLYLYDPAGNAWATTGLFVNPDITWIEIEAKSLKKAIRKARKRIAVCKKKKAQEQTRWP